MYRQDARSERKKNNMSLRRKRPPPILSKSLRWWLRVGIINLALHTNQTADNLLISYSNNMTSGINELYSRYDNSLWNGKVDIYN